MDASEMEWGVVDDSGEEREKEEDKTADSGKEEEPEEDVADAGELFEPEDEDAGGEEPDEGGQDDDAPFYSKIARAIAEDGIFQTVDEEAIKNVKDADGFSELIEKEVSSRLNEQTRRVSAALQAGVEPDQIRSLEGTINFLDNLTEDKLKAESKEAEQLRKSLIYQDYVNHGSSPERAQKMVERSIKAGTDVDDALEALNGNREYYRNAYKGIVDNAKRQAEHEKAETKRQAEELRKSIMDDNKAFGDVELDKGTRRLVYDNIMKPVYTDPDTGERMSAIEKYSDEHHLEFIKNVGLLYTLTDGFKNIDKLVKSRVKKEMNKGIRSLERTINHSSRTPSGQLNFASGSKTDPESKFVKFDLNI